MSADNRLCVMLWGGLQWHVWHGSGSVTYYEPPLSAKAFNTDREAYEYAYREADRIGYLEYGVTLIGASEQESVLAATIRNLEQRLSNLRVVGYFHGDKTRKSLNQKAERSDTK